MAMFMRIAILEGLKDWKFCGYASLQDEVRKQTHGLVSSGLERLI